ncbi:hypothetical protein PA45B_A016 (plasmid) [Escherichia coli]|nr:hypothetical protein PA45B_A016 [Escherichia coli]
MVNYRLISLALTIASTIFGVHYSLRNFRICQTVLRRRLLFTRKFHPFSSTQVAEEPLFCTVRDINTALAVRLRLYHMIFLCLIINYRIIEVLFYCCWK